MVDIVPLIFYGVVCTVLAAVLPPRFPLWVRSAIGATVGIGAALCLPLLRASLGV